MDDATKQKTRLVLSKPFANLPVTKDLPRLAKYITICDGEGRILRSTKDLFDDSSSYDHVRDVLVTLSRIFDGDERAQQVHDSFSTVMTPMNYTLPEVLRSYVDKHLGGDSSQVVKVLKAVNQAAISSAVIELKMRLGADNTTKDVAQSWKIIILVRDDCILVRQRKRERDIQEQFEFQWELTVKLERKMAFCQDVSLQITDLMFSDKIKGQRMNEVLRLLKKYCDPALLSRKMDASLVSASRLRSQATGNIPALPQDAPAAAAPDTPTMSILRSSIPVVSPRPIPSHVGVTSPRLSTSSITPGALNDGLVPQAAVMPTTLLLPGEKVLWSNEKAFSCLQLGARDLEVIPGSVYVTNFKCLFTPDPQQLSESVLTMDLQRLTCMVGLLAVVQCRKSKTSLKGARGVPDHVVELVCKDFRVLRLAFSSPSVRKEFTDCCLPARLKHTFAFRYSYKVAPAQDGWQFYDPAEELERFGLPNHQWRISEANSNYELAPSYPRVLVIPSHIQDKELSAIAAHRQQGRLPVLCWRHAGANITLCRASRPKPPASAESSSAAPTRCFNDEKLLGAIVQASVHLLGATPYYVIDCGEKDSGVARTKAAYQQAIDVNVQFLGLETMAAVREAHARLHKAVTSIRDESDDSHSKATHWMTAVLATHWLDVVRNYLAKAVEVVEVMRRGSSVLLMSTNGVDRSSVTSSLVQLMLDPYYRTISGFQILVEKEWLSLGFPFADRCAHLRSSNETQESPTFLLFLDCFWQIMEQFPCAFEFNAQFLETLFFHLYSGLYGTFLMNNDKERRSSLVRMETISLWTAINEDIESYRNPFFAEVTTALLPVVTPYTVRLWEEVYLRHQPEYFPRSQARDQWARDQLEHLADLQTDFSSRSGGSSRPSSMLDSTSRPSSLLQLHTGGAGRTGSNGQITEELAEGDPDLSAMRSRAHLAEQRAEELQQKLEVLEFCVKQQKSEAKSARRERRRTHTSSSPRKDTASSGEKSKRRPTRTSSSSSSRSLNRRQVASLNASADGTDASSNDGSASASASASASSSTTGLPTSMSSESIASTTMTDNSESEHET
eukprot:CAMPEP_0177679270 /NCGR_PEP_ID=MMETSP0447-20121125/29505_1 /TAXON_ID=0 /ORGANISM="Stygamoeba regulata, Strain BSH-02190019" /LENGTH=1069 /DNA_ID=CAMNT_0019188433 /DNA_START=92 /DNA_END=3301 /DNA_ORIENTATION=-